MKRALGILLILILVSSATQAEMIIDVDQYSTEELIRIKEIVESEINNRTESPIEVILPGKYVAGIDISTGTYNLIGLMDESPDGSSSQILWAENNERTKVADYIGSEFLVSSEKLCVSLTKGMILEIRYCECAIQKATSSIFAPNK